MHVCVYIYISWQEPSSITTGPTSAATTTQSFFAPGGCSNRNDRTPGGTGGTPRPKRCGNEQGDLTQQLIKIFKVRKLA